ncbi:aminodeoxychorismate synthase, component I [Anaerobacillus alkaliphilus]|uniref:aminodeoxychorismate synthase, component I n=1 Tax=Anaerobacillus alkaliphilus TaxID=1548597 RepID=UPI0026C12430
MGQTVTNQTIRRFSVGKSIKATDFDWFAKYKELAKTKKHHALLESGRGGRYSIIGLDPWAILSGKNQKLTITMKDQAEVKEGPLLTSMKEWMATYRTEVNDDLPEFQGGAVGFISYDLVRQFEELPEVSQDDLETEDIYFLLFEDVFVLDHKEELFWIITHYEEGKKTVALERLDELEKLWFAPTKIESWDYSNLEFTDYWDASLSQEDFMTAVKKVQNYIANGDVFQVNLSVRQTKKLETEPFHIYEKLREINPSPYMSYFETPEFQLVSASPELLVKKQGEDISTRPIAGTRSRGKDAAEDEMLARTLIENEKEKAEHVMLVDLERNDLGRVSQFGTVEVNELMVIEKYSHVMHIVSNVRGKLDPTYDVYDVIEATFPGGTITGAPKVRTMEIIEELEPVRRGVYTGSIGWIGYNGNMELNIAIRTLVAKNGFAYVQAGAGIVIDSDPEAEYKESLKKAMALWKAKELSEEEKSKVKS